MAEQEEIKKIFVNYRRGDDPGFAGRIFDYLSREFPRESLFMDVDDIPAGKDFVEVLGREVAQCSVFLAVVGKNWLQIDPKTGTPRLEKENDFVRIEIDSANRCGVRIIPVLVNQALMPTEADLPDVLKFLARRNAIRITHERFHSDCTGLVRSIREAFETAELEREQKQKLIERESLEKERQTAMESLSQEIIEKAEELVNWNFIQKSDDPDNFRDHLARFPEGVSSEPAKARLEKLECHSAVTSTIGKEQSRVRTLRAVRTSLFLMLGGAILTTLYFQRNALVIGVRSLLMTPEVAPSSPKPASIDKQAIAENVESIRQAALSRPGDPLALRRAASTMGIPVEERSRFYNQAIEIHANNGNNALVSELLVELAQLLENVARPKEAAALLQKADENSPISESFFGLIAQHHSDEKVRREYELKLASSGSIDEREANRRFDRLIEEEGNEEARVELIRKAAARSTGHGRRIELYRQGWDLGDFECGENLFEELRRSDGSRTEASEVGIALLDSDGDIGRRVKVAENLRAFSGEEAARWLADNHPDTDQSDEWRLRYVLEFGWQPEYAESLRRAAEGDVPGLSTADRSSAAWQYFNALPEARKSSSDREAWRLLTIAREGGNPAAIRFFDQASGNYRNPPVAPGTEQWMAWIDFLSEDSKGTLSRPMRKAKALSVSNPSYRNLITAFEAGNPNASWDTCLLHSGIHGNFEIDRDDRNPETAIEAGVRIFLDEHASLGRRNLIKNALRVAIDGDQALQDAADRHRRGDALLSALQ